MWDLLMGTFPSHSSLGSSTFAMGQCTRQAQSAFSSSLQVVAYTRSTSWFGASEDVLPAVKNECGPYPGRVERSDSVRVSVSNARRCRNGVLNVPLTMWRRRGHCPCSMLVKSRGMDAAEGQRMQRLQRLRRLQRRRKNTPVSRPRSDLRKAVRASTNEKNAVGATLRCCIHTISNKKEFYVLRVLYRRFGSGMDIILFCVLHRCIHFLFNLS